MNSAAEKKIPVQTYPQPRWGESNPDVFASKVYYHWTIRPAHLLFIYYIKIKIENNICLFLSVFILKLKYKIIFVYF